MKLLNRNNIGEEMDSNKIKRKSNREPEDGSKWVELANVVARENREISIKNVKEDPTLQEIHEQRKKIFSNLPLDDN